MSDIITDRQLSDMFDELGKSYGFKRTTASFTEYRDVKVNWTRSTNGEGSWIDFMISDYLRDVPADLVRQIGETILYRTTHPTEDVPLPPAVNKYLANDDFSKKHRDTYLSRLETTNDGPHGEAKCLDKLWNELIDEGYVDSDDDMQLVWGFCGKNKPCMVSTLMKVIVMSDYLDDGYVPDDVIKFLLYYEYLFYKEGLYYFDSGEKIDREKIMRKYPDCAKLRNTIRSMGYSI